MSQSDTAFARFWAPPPEPATKLGRHRQLAPLAGIHVSPICLGAMSLGDKWGDLSLKSMDKEECYELLDAFYAAGGNFIDTASNYQDEESEKVLGEWMETRGIRDQMVVATKYTTNYKRGVNIPQKTHYTGNNVKSLHLSIEASLKKLRTSYVDILYLHWWDWTCGVEEVMNALHNLVVAGKVLYLGISDTPAWVVTEANTYARLMGKTPFVVYQGPWSILQREFERDIIPMCRAQGMALAPWNVLSGGKIRSDEEEERRLKSGEKGRAAFTNEWMRTPDERKVCQALEKVAAEVGAKSITAVAIAYVMQKTPYVFPIVGGHKIEHLMDNIQALEIALSAEQVAYLEGILPFDPGFPASMIGDGTRYPGPFGSAGYFDKWPLAQAIRPVKRK